MNYQNMTSEDLLALAEKRKREEMEQNIKEGELQLYVWTDFSPDYTSGLAFALARSKEEAVELIEHEHFGRVYDWGFLEVYDLDRPIAFAVSGGS